MRKPAFSICENEDADQLRGDREADQRFFFATRIVQSLYFLNTKFQATSHPLWLYSLVCVGPGRKPGSPVFSQRGSIKVKGDTLVRHLFHVSGIIHLQCVSFYFNLYKYIYVIHITNIHSCRTLYPL